MLAVSGNTTCESYYSNPALNLTGFVLYYFISKCSEEDADSLGGSGGRGVDEFLTAIANEYFSEASQIVWLYDESWDITDVIIKVGNRTRKSFITYFLPLDPTYALRITSKPADHFSHKALPKGTAFIVFVKNEEGFANVLELTSKYPWWSKRARVVILVKERALEPTKGILALLEKENIFNGVVVTEVAGRLDNTSSPGMMASSQGSSGSANADHQEDVISALMSVECKGASLQVAALDPYPLPGQPKHSYIARWSQSEFTTQLRPIFHQQMDNLRGHKLLACVFEFPPLVIKVQKNPEDKPIYSGLEVKIFQELGIIMNFTYEFFEPPSGQRWGEDLGNNTWSGLIGETQRKADIGFSSIFLLDNREKAVDVSTPYDQDKGCFAVPRPEALQHWLGLILPFSWKVWACILAMAFVAGPTFSLITRPLKHDQSFTIGRGIYYALGSMVSTQKAPKAKSHSLRSFIITWLIFCWIAAILYRVALIVSLTVGPTNYRIDTLNQLVRAKLEWGGFEEVIKTFSNTSGKNKEQDKDLFERFVPLKNITKGLDRVAEGGDFAVLDSGKYLRYAATGRYYDGYSSSIHIAKECPTSYNVAFIMPIGSPFLEKVNVLIRHMQNSGLIDKWLADILFETALKNPNKNRRRKKDRGLTFGHLKLCFVIIAGGYFSGFVALCFEYGIQFYNKRKGELADRIAAALPALILRKHSQTSSSIGSDTTSFIIVDTDAESSRSTTSTPCHSVEDVRPQSISDCDQLDDVEEE